MATSAGPGGGSRDLARSCALASAPDLSFSSFNAERRHDLAALGAFLRTRRERLAPHAVGLAVAGGRRRAQGLRREDVADLAQLSTGWYTRLEQGQDVHPSPTTLRAIGAALRLDAPELVYLFRLAGVTAPIARWAPGACPPVGDPAVVLRAVDAVPSPEMPDGTPPALRRLLDSVLVPALVMDRYWDVVGRNAALKRFYPGLAAVRTRPDAPPRNVVRHVLRSKDVHAGAPEWEVLARACVAGLRMTLAEVWAERPGDPHAMALVDALTGESPEFRAWWPEHRVWAADRPLRRTYDHPHLGLVVVDITLLDVRSAPGLTLVTYLPGDAPTATKLHHLAGAPAAGSQGTLHATPHATP